MGFSYTTNRKKLNKKRKKVKLERGVVKDNWNWRKKAATNLKDMGLVYNVNTAIAHPSIEDLQSEELPNAGIKKMSVIPTLETDAQSRAMKAKNKAPRLTLRQLDFVKGMIQRHGSDLEAMARDPKNYFQLTPRQIEKEIEKYNQIPFYHAKPKEKGKKNVQASEKANVME